MPPLRTAGRTGAAIAPAPNGGIALALWSLLGLALLPHVLDAFGQGFYTGFASRVLVYALAASSLNLVIGNAGMLSFGHAAFLGAGAYCAALLVQGGTTSAWILWPAAMCVAALAALVIGAISLRTRGVYFIMITLAFAQMLYYLFVSLKAWGGDDGINLAARPRLALGQNLAIDLADEFNWYYLCLAVLALALWLSGRLAASRFGRVIAAQRENEVRTEAIGFPVYRYKLILFVIAGAVAGLAGALLAAQNGFVSPKLMHWTQSGSLMVMVILGGVGHRYAGVLGATVLLGLEELLSAHTLHWAFWVGLVLLAVVLFAPRGLSGMFSRPAGGR